jgi:two-component system, LuxR family, response regulator FixJ
VFDPPVIAIIDDDEAIREALCDLLQVLGFACEAFERAEAFMATPSPARFGCVITDVRMPGMNGLELLEHIKAMRPTMPVIIVTSHRDPLVRHRALECGAHAFLTKPVAEHTLLPLLQAALRQGRIESRHRKEFPE